MDKVNKTTLILASLNPEDTKFYGQVSRALGFPLVLVKNLPEMEAALAGKRDSSFLFIDVDGVDDSSGLDLPLKSMGMLLARMSHPSRVIAVVGDFSMRLAQDIPRANFGHFFLRKYDLFGEKWIKTLILGLTLGRINNLTDFLRDGGHIRTAEVTRSGLKNQLIQTLRVELSQLGFPPKVVEVILSSTDELIMNAIFDAPKDKEGRHYRRESSRDSDFELVGREKVSVIWIRNPSFTMIGVTDQFGSFDRGRATEAAFADYQGVYYEPNTRTRSAHLGFHRITSSGVSYLALVQPGVLTHAALVFPNHTSLRDLRDSFRSFSVLNFDPG